MYYVHFTLNLCKPILVQDSLIEANGAWGHAPRRSKLIPIVGFPSFVPGWNLTAIKMNFMVLRSSESFGYIENCEASSPFEIYKLLEDIFHMHVSDYDIYVSPLGTRPHCLGAALFASNFSSSYLIYDFPVEKKFRSQNVLKANFYNLTKFIK